MNERAKANDAAQRQESATQEAQLTAPGASADSGGQQFAPGATPAEGNQIAPAPSASAEGREIVAARDPQTALRRNIRWQHTDLSRNRRWQALGVRGATIWLTGLPSSGKSTLGAALEQRLVEAGRHAYLLDGDNLRHGICADLGFSQADRDRNVERVGELAALFADAGTIALVALVSPYADTRARVRELHARAELPFFEVFIDTPLWMCVERDPKGLYARAISGDINGFTGVDDPYEAPEHAELHLTPEQPLQAAVEQVLARLLSGSEAAPEEGSAGPGGSERAAGTRQAAARRVASIR